MSLAQVLRLLAVERVGDAPQHEHVQLDPSLPLGLHPLLLLESLGGSGLAQTLTLGSLVSLKQK